MQKDLTAVEVVIVAIGKEREAEELYKRMADEIKNPLVKEKFLSLSREESKHEEILTRIYRKMTGEAKAPALKYESPAKTLPKADATLEDLFLFAIDRERDAQRIYTQAAEMAADESGRRTFKYLADFERGHEMLLTSELEDYRRDKNWYSDMPDIMLVGP
jgi:rubrerythrin